MYAQNTEALFKTKTIDVLFRTPVDTRSLEIYNLTAYKFFEFNRILLMWSDDSLAKMMTYELRYWSRNDSKRTNSLRFETSAKKFIFKGSISNCMLQLRKQSYSGSWGSFTPPVEAIPISTHQTAFNTTSFNQIATNELYHLTSTIIIVSFIILSFVAILFLLYLKLIKKSFSSSLNTTKTNKTATSSSSSSSSIQSDLSNQLNNAINTTSLSNESEISSDSLLQNTLKTYVNPHSYEDPTKLVSLFAKELWPFNIQIESIIGSGEFGDVCKGCLRDANSSHVVAIKTLRDRFTEQNRCDFLTEASIMVQFQHKNVIKLEGVVTRSFPLMIVTEFMENGSLDLFLKKNQHQIKIKEMIRILRDVASGMSYLCDRNFIHRDLAARNILIDSCLTCKVADFGLSRILDNNSLEYTTQGGKIPIRWTAPEAFSFRKYSSASDVWSFGVLAYEVLSYGDRPYWNWQNSDVIKAVQASYKLPAPRVTPDCLYNLMLKCWNDDRLLRPRFYEMVTYFDEIINLEHELNTPSRIKELMPIDPYQPTQIQLTSTRQFLISLKLDHYLDVFHKNGLLNLANLFVLSTDDLAFDELNISNELDRKLIVNELKKISNYFMNSITSKLNNYIVSEHKIVSNSFILQKNSSEIDFLEQSNENMFIIKANEFIV